MATEHALYTWDPVSQAWVHERGPEIPPPPAPPDVHALQSYFFDEDGKQWIRTVLAPMGRELAAKWQGAHKIPDDALKNPRPATAAKPLAKKKGGSPVAVIAIAVVLLVMLGGAGVVASQTGMLAQVAPESVAKAIASAAPTPAASAAATPEPSPSASPSPSATAATGGGGGGGVVRTNPPAAPAITAPPNSITVKLGDGTTMYYTGPTAVLKNTQLPASFLVANANGRPATGVVVVILGDQRGSTQGQGIIDAQGRLTVQVLASQLSGQYPLSVLYNNQLTQVALITIR